MSTARIVIRVKRQRCRRMGIVSRGRFPFSLKLFYYYSYTHTSQPNRMAACLCCLFCGIIGAIIPLCFNWCADIDHVCPRCHKMVAHMPYEGKMEPVLPNSGPAFKPSQFQPPAAPPK